MNFSNTQPGHMQSQPRLSFRTIRSVRPASQQSYQVGLESDRPGFDSRLPIGIFPGRVIPILFYSRLCPSTTGNSSPPESSNFLCPLLSLSILLPVAPQHNVISPTTDRLVGLVVKASASRAEGPGFESRLRRVFFGAESYQWLKHWHSSGYPARRLAL